MGSIVTSHARSGGGGGGFYNAYAKVSDTKAYATNGGSSVVSASWIARDMNTVDSDSEGILSVASDQITLEADTYVFSITSPSYQSDRYTIRLYDTTGAAILGEINNTSFAGVGEGLLGMAFLNGKFTISVQSILEIQYKCQAAKANQGLGLSQTLDAAHPSIFTIAEFWRLV